MREGWKELPISDVLDVSIGGVWGSDPGIDEIDVSVYRQTEFDDDGKLLMPSDAVRSITKNQLKSRRLEAGDVLMQKSAGTPTLPGRVVIVPPEIERNATCSNFLHLLRANTRICNPQFLFWYLWINHQSRRAFEFQRGTNIKNLDLNQYLDQRMMLPPLQEQRRIADLMSSVDSYVAALQQQADAARSARSAVLSELLSAGGDDWTETTLGPLITLRTGKLDVNAGVDNGEFPFFTCSRDTYKIDVAAYAGKSVIVAGNGDLNVKYYEGEFNAYQRTYILQSVDETVLNPKFLFCFMEKYVETLRNDTQGSTIQYLKKGQFIDAPIGLPSLVEQSRIVDVVSSMDEIIKSVEQAVADAKNLRSGLLSDLLSGDHEIPESYDRLLGAA